MGHLLCHRIELVRELAAELPVAEALPDTHWSASLQAEHAALAEQLALWRVTNGTDRSEYRPCGPPGDDDAYRRRLDAYVHVASAGSSTHPADRAS